MNFNVDLWMHVCMYLCEYVCVYKCMEFQTLLDNFQHLQPVRTLLSGLWKHAQAHTYIHTYIHRIHAYSIFAQGGYLHLELLLGDSEVEVRQEGGIEPGLQVVHSLQKFQLILLVRDRHLDACMYVCMYERIYVCMNVCMYVCMYVWNP